MFGGDLNETPSEGLIQEVVPAIGGQLTGLGRPTRFEGQREIDFFGSNCPHALGLVTSPDIALSDHRILQVKVDIPAPRPSRGVIPKGPRFTRPTECPAEEWRDKLSVAWDRAKGQLGTQEFLNDPTRSAQAKWDHFQTTLRCCFLSAMSASPADVRRSRFKGSVANVRSETLPKTGAMMPMKERKLRHRLARWHELGRLRGKLYTTGLSAPQAAELNDLCKKVTGATDLPSRQTISTMVAQLEGELYACRKKSKEANLATWRARMLSSSSHVSKWLRSKEWSMCNSIICPDGSVTQNWQEGASAILQYWNTFWSDLQAQIPAFTSRQAALLAGVPPPQQTVDLPFPTGLQLQAAAADGRGAAGPDNWSADEIKFLPLDAFNTVAQLFKDFAQHGEVPRQFRQSRMVCLPKPGKSTSVGIKVSDTRPISVMSVFWRLWSSSLCRSTAMRTWLRSTLTAQVAGLSREDLYENIIEIFDDFHRNGFLLTLDYSKAFDCLDSDLSCSLLRAHGWPEDLVRLLQATWVEQKRFVQWDHHTGEKVLDASRVQLQKGPFGPSHDDPVGPIRCS